MAMPLALVRRLDSLKALRTQESNLLHAGLTETLVLDDIYIHLAFLDKRIKAVTQHIQTLVEQHPQLKQQRDLLVSIPGLSDITATKAARCPAYSTTETGIFSHPTS